MFNRLGLSDTWASLTGWAKLKPYWVLSFLCLALYLPGLGALPPFDRDEARYVQASKQMLETGNYIDIRFQQEARYKKPVGVYWLQTAAVKTFAGGNKTALWAYRMPSFLAAWGAVLTLFAVASVWFGSTAAWVSALSLAPCLLLLAESHLAKTDAPLFLLSLLAFSALGMIYQAKNHAKKRWALLFWLALAGGILVKGPLLPAMLALTALTLLFLEARKGQKPVWLGQLGLFWGLPLLVLLVAPWFVAIHQLSGGQFWQGSVVQDILPKVLSGQESHFGVPGLYTVLSLALFFPGSVLVWGWLPQTLKAFFKTLFGQTQASKMAWPTAVWFCLAWLIPNWLGFELMPTKLSHYILPLLAPLALLNGYFCSQWQPSSFKTLLKRLIGWTLAMIVFSGLVLGLGLPALKPFWISPQIKASLDKEVAPWQPQNVILVGFHEPSAVFLLGTPITLTGPVEAAALATARASSKTAPVLAIIERRAQPDFEAALRAAHTPVPSPKPVATGLNYSKFKWTELFLYAFPLSPAPVN